MRIIRAIEFHGRLGLPLRGHDDSGTLSIPVRDQLQQLSHLDYSEGNLRALLQLMIDCDDEILRKHFRTAPKRATYISPLSQNQIIDAISNVMQRKIVSEVQNAQFFTLLADETTDFSKQEQLSVCLRYVTKSFTIKERLLGFAIAPDLTGKGLAKQLIRILVDAGTDKAYIKKYMVGQGYDGASAMSGQHNGVQKHILDKCPLAVYVHCSSHCLNLCLAKASEIPAIRSAVTLMNELAVSVL